jgi:hypothetical protein
MRIKYTAILFILTFYNCDGQNNESIKTISLKSINTISVGINIPVGNFSATHNIGINTEYSLVRHRFGISNQNKIDFACNAGIAYYVGKKETVSSYLYKYPGYIFIHGFGGILYSPANNAGVSVTAGPALGIYNGNIKFNIGSKLEANYYIRKTLSIGSGMIFMKESGANPVGALFIRASIVIL